MSRALHIFRKTWEYPMFSLTILETLHKQAEKAKQHYKMPAGCGRFALRHSLVNKTERVHCQQTSPVRNTKWSSSDLSERTLNSNTNAYEKIKSRGKGNTLNLHRSSVTWHFTVEIKIFTLVLKKLNVYSLHFFINNYLYNIQDVYLWQIFSRKLKTHL